MFGFIFKKFESWRNKKIRQMAVRLASVDICEKVSKTRVCTLISPELLFEAYNDSGYFCRCTFKVSGEAIRAHMDKAKQIIEEEYK